MQINHIAKSLLFRIKVIHSALSRRLLYKLVHRDVLYLQMLSDETQWL